MPPEARLINPGSEPKKIGIQKQNSRAMIEFLGFVEQRFGVYLDSVQGFNLNYKAMLENQQFAQDRLKKSIQSLDLAAIIRSNYDPSPNLKECAEREKHRMTQGQYKRNNARGGLNHRIALEDCLCAIFNYWKEFKRDVLIKMGGKRDEEIMPIIAYLGAIRDRLTHKKNNPEKEKSVDSYSCQYLQYSLPSFSKEDDLVLTERDLDAIVDELRGWIQADFSD